MKLYKLTDEHDQTYNQTQWGENVTHTVNGEGELCGPGWIHAYTDPLLAVLLNPIHANFVNPHLWEAEGEIGKTDHGLKVGGTKVTTLTRMALPVIMMEQRVRFAILCAKHVCGDTAWNRWADDWLSGKDRAADAAWAAADAATRAAEAAADVTTWAATWTATWAADAAMWAAQTAAQAAQAAQTAADAAMWAVWSAAQAAQAAQTAAWAAWAAADAAGAAATAEADIDLIAIAHEAVNEPTKANKEDE